MALVRYVMRYKSLFRYLSVRDTENYDTVLKKYGLDSRHYDGIEKIHFVYAGGFPMYGRHKKTIHSFAGKGIQQGADALYSAA